MTSQQLFIALLHRLGYREAMVLHAVLQQGADVREFKTSSTQLALDLLANQVKRSLVQRALDKLENMGLIQLRSHANYRTLITADREAILALLRTPVSEYLPGLRTDGFSFLDAANAAMSEDKPDSTDF